MSKWYAVMTSASDNDWGYGSHDLSEALNMVVEYIADGGYIAVIEEGSDPLCVEEIRDFSGYFDTYYTLHTDEDGVTLYKGFSDQGKRYTVTETSVLSFPYEAAGVDDPHTDDDAERVKNWGKLDGYISERLGFCPDYD